MVVTMSFLKNMLILINFVLILSVFSQENEEKQKNVDEKKEKPDVGNVIGIDLGTTYSW